MKRQIVAAGLAALVSGCDSQGTRTIEGCQVGDLTLKPEYHSMKGMLDYVSIDFYKGDVKVGGISPLVVEYLGNFNNQNTSFACDNGGELLVSTKYIGFQEAGKKTE